MLYNILGLYKVFLAKRRPPLALLKMRCLQNNGSAWLSRERNVLPLYVLCGEGFRHTSNTA